MNDARLVFNVSQRDNRCRPTARVGHAAPKRMNNLGLASHDCVEEPGVQEKAAQHQQPGCWLLKQVSATCCFRKPLAAWNSYRCNADHPCTLNSLKLIKFRILCYVNVYHVYIHLAQNLIDQIRFGRNGKSSSSKYEVHQKKRRY